MRVWGICATPEVSFGADRKENEEDLLFESRFNVSSAQVVLGSLACTDVMRGIVVSNGLLGDVLKGQRKVSSRRDSFGVQRRAAKRT